MSRPEIAKPSRRVSDGKTTQDDRRWDDADEDFDAILYDKSFRIDKRRADSTSTQHTLHQGFPKERIAMDNVYNYGINNFSQLKFVSHIDKTEMADNCLIRTFSVPRENCNIDTYMDIFDKEPYTGNRIAYRLIDDADGDILDMYVIYEHMFVRASNGNSGKVNVQIGALTLDIINKAKVHIGITEDLARYCKWHFAKGSEIWDLRLPIKTPKPCTDKHIPWVTDGVDAFCKSYTESDSSILIMLGPPGTGKTSFINHIIANYNRNAMITYDRSVMCRDDFYIDFISDTTYNTLILEDADPILHRKEGERSEVLSKILNVGDGLVDITNKKIIITANLESIEDIDPAIARKGRCFDILMSRPMTHNEANELAVQEGIETNYRGDITLAEFYNGMNKVRRASRKFGFSA